MRVALLTNFIPPYRVPLYQEIQRRCSELRIFLSATTESNRQWAPEWGSLPVEVQRNIALRGFWRHPNRFSEPTTVHVPYDTIPRLLRFQPNVVVSAELGMRSAQAAAYCRMNGKASLVIWATLSDVTEQGRGPLRDWLRPKILKHADSVIINGKGGSRYLRQLGVDPVSMFRAPYTTNLEPFLALKPDRLPQVRHRLVYSGSLTERKGLRLFLPILLEWSTKHPKRQVELVVAGTGPLEAELSNFSGPSNLEIKLVGAVPYEKMPDVYRNAGILVFPTLADEWGMVVTEAMAAGVPVLGSIYSQAVEELVVDRQSGWTFRPDRSLEAYAALDCALNLPVESVNDVARRARAAVCEFTPAAVADKVLSAMDYARRVVC